MRRSRPASDLGRSKDRNSNLIYSNIRRFFVILAENLYTTAPRPVTFRKGVTP
jgi:hypothetical protein